MINYRTDRNNNPAAFTTDIAAQGGLLLGTDYVKGDPFTVGPNTYFTASLLGNPLQLTLKVIDAIGFYNKFHEQRWTYIGMPVWVWQKLDTEEKIKIVQFMYHHEGGTTLEHLFL